MEDCMKHDESNRTISESKIFSSAIRNIVAADGEERKIRHVSVVVWRAFFARVSVQFQFQPFNGTSSGGVDVESKQQVWKSTTHRLLELYLEELTGVSTNKIASFELLNKYGSQLKRFRNVKPNEQSPQTTCGTSGRQVPSAESISKLADMKLRKRSHGIDGLLSLKEPIETHQDNDYDVKEAELVLNLTLAAEKICNQDFNRAEKLLSSCHHVAVTSATPVQKVVHYFAEALRERIDIDKGLIDLERKTVQVEECPNSLHPANIASEVELPFSQISGSVATQVILDSVGSAERIHIIDFRVKSGSHWTMVMDAIANRENCPLDLLKITAVGTSIDMLEETGRRLSSFAESMNLPFSFKIVLSELEDLKTDFFELEAGDVVAVYLDMCLWSLLARPDSLEAFI
ncbi:hypothetical protein Pfo_026668 [Paulownia fortunei]|nr:hypothetical protein Pfo_026668 [Paulownia fortunei]